MPRRDASAPAKKASVVDHVRYLTIRPDALIELERPRGVVFKTTGPDWVDDDTQ